MPAEVPAQPPDREARGLPSEVASAIGLLGPVVLLGDGDEALGGPKQRLVLALLACEAGRVVPVDRLATAVWGEDAEESARRTLQVHVSRLRKALGDVASIDHRDGGYVLEVADGGLDVAWFERLVDEGITLRQEDPDRAADRLREALRLWRGRPFGDLASEAALSAEETRLEQLRLRAFEELAEIEIGRGQQDGVLDELHRLARDHRLRERLWQLLMRGLYRSGRQGEALEAYETLRSNLADELGADPSRESQDLHTAMLRHDPSLEPPEQSAAGTGPGAWVTAEGGGHELVGRERELSRLRSLLRAAVAGRTHLVLHGGEAGVGKSRLLEETSSIAHAEGLQTLVGRCIELGDTALPFAPVAQILRNLVSGRTADEISEVLGPARHELARVAPVLGDPPAAPAGREGADPELRGRVFSALLDGLGRLARHQPLLVAFEDVHWADRSTLDLLDFLARNLDRERLLLVATFRTDELHRRHPLRGVVGELTRLPNVVRMDLEPLTPDEVATLVRSIAGDDVGAELLDDVVSRSSGNPFFVEELVAAAQEHGARGLGSGLRDVVVSRLEPLPDECRRLLDVAAVAGGSVDERLLAAVTGDDPLVLSRQLRPAVDRHVLLVEDAGYRFRHDLLREAVDDELLPGERVALHAQIAAALEQDRGLASGGADHAAAETAHHWYAAREDQRAFDASLRAADRARATGALAEALALEERVLELWDRVDHGTADRVTVLERASRTARLTGRYRRGEALLREALQEVGDDPLREADVRRELALALAWDARDREQAVAEAERALELVDDQPPSERTARIMHAVARLRLMSEDKGERPLTLGREAIRVAQELGDRRTEAHARNTVGTVLASSGRDVETGLTELRASLRLAQELDDAELMARGHNNLIVALRASLTVDRAIVGRAIEEALSWLEQAPQREHLQAHAIIRNNIAMTALFHGDWDRAEEVLDDLPVEDLEGYDRAYHLTARSLLRWSRGQLDGARQDARTVLGLDVDEAGSVDWAHTIEAFVAAEQGQVEEVHRIVEERERLAADSDEVDGEVVFVDLRLLRVLVRVEVDAALAADDAAARAGHVRRAEQALVGVRERHRVLKEEQVPTTPATRHVAKTNLLIAEAERARVGQADPNRWRAVVDHAIPDYERIYARWRLGEALFAAGEDGADELRSSHAEACRRGAELLRRRIELTARDHQVVLEDHPTP